MFSTSTQNKNWLFRCEEDLAELRKRANRKYVESHGADIYHAVKYDHFLTPEEEKIVLKRYELNLRDICDNFTPPMPKEGVATAFHYFKRFYLNNSVMKYNPKEIMITCLYVALKVEEFYVSMPQFLANLEGDREKAAHIILSNEFLLLHEMNYQLLIHNPFRPAEGLLIDIKTRTNFYEPERLRRRTGYFLQRVLLTDVILLYPPSQIALAAVLYAASKMQENLHWYITDVLLNGEGGSKLSDLINDQYARWSRWRTLFLIETNYKCWIRNCGGATIPNWQPEQ